LQWNHSLNVIQKLKHTPSINESLVAQNNGDSIEFSESTMAAESFTYPSSTTSPSKSNLITPKTVSQHDTLPVSKYSRSVLSPEQENQLALDKKKINLSLLTICLSIISTFAGAAIIIGPDLVIGYILFGLGLAGLVAGIIALLVVSSQRNSHEFQIQLQHLNATKNPEDYVTKSPAILLLEDKINRSAKALLITVAMMAIGLLGGLLLGETILGIGLAIIGVIGLYGAFIYGIVYLIRKSKLKKLRKTEFLGPANQGPSYTPNYHPVVTPEIMLLEDDVLLSQKRLIIYACVMAIGGLLAWAAGETALGVLFAIAAGVGFYGILICFITLLIRKGRLNKARTKLVLQNSESNG
jgi:hypothetical protein